MKKWITTIHSISKWIRILIYIYDFYSIIEIGGGILP